MLVYEMMLAAYLLLVGLGLLNALSVACETACEVRALGCSAAAGDASLVARIRSA
jgi:hypothetical protein